MMVLIFLALTLILFFFYNTRLFAYGLMVFYVTFDMFDGFYDDEKIFAAVRYLIPLSLITFIVVRDTALRKKDTILLILIFYLLMLLVSSSADLISSAKNTLAVILTLIMIPVGRYMGKRVNVLEEFEPYNRFLLIALPLYIIMANIFHFGESYTDAFMTGFLVTSRMYVVPIVVFLAIHYVISGRTNNPWLKGIDIASIVVNICIILINTRRTAVGMLLGAMVIYTILNRAIVFKMVILTFCFVTSLVVCYPLYEDILTAQLEKRERIQNIDTYDEEGRVLETLYLIDYHSKRQNPLEILFGVKLFDTYDFGTRYFGRDRPIHSDLNMIFFSTGLIGVMIFSALFIDYFLIGNRRMVPENRKIYYALLAMFAMVLLPGRFIGTLTYAPMLMFLLASVKACRAPEYEEEEEDNDDVPDASISTETRTTSLPN